MNEILFKFHRLDKIKQYLKGEIWDILFVLHELKKNINNKDYNKTMKNIMKLATKLENLLWSIDMIIDNLNNMR